MKNKTKGFGALMVLLVLVIIILVCLVGFLVYENSSKDTAQDVANVQTQTQTDASVGGTPTNDLTKEEALQMYVENTGEPRPTTVLNPVFKNSKIAGYRTAEVSMGNDMSGFMALFYQTPDQSWHFFTGTQSVMSCSKYNTQDLKKAYAGDPCFLNSSTQGTVTVD